MRARCDPRCRLWSRLWAASLPRVSWVDIVALLVVVVTAYEGARRGLLTGALSLVGVVLGLFIGGQVAPHVLGNSRSAYTPLVGLAAALLLAIVFESLGAITGGALRRALSLGPLKTLDSLGGLVLGAATGFAILWLIAAVTFNIPQGSDLRRQARESGLLTALMDLVPPQSVLRALTRIDPFPAIMGPPAPSSPADPRVLRLPGVRTAEPSVVRVLTNACGTGYAGSGWVGRRDLVVTAAHVVAGGSQIVVERQDGRRFQARAVAFDGGNDLAVLSVRQLGLKPLAIVAPHSGDTGALLGFPGDGPFDAEPARVGTTREVLAPDYARHFVSRTITSVRARVRHGNSGGPVVNRKGAVEASIFGARTIGSVGYGVPGDLVRDLLADVDLSGVSTGRCLP
jgi:S1-C subfamily serine protease